MSARELQTSRPRADEGSAQRVAGHPPAVSVGFDWLQTARRGLF